VKNHMKRPLKLLVFCLFMHQDALAKDIPSREIKVYKNSECECCTRWVEYLESYNYKVTKIETENIYGIKRKLGVPSELSACHTAFIDGYVVEGHVTERDIKRLLLFRPNVKGIAVPGMPIGTPGMERGNEKESYNVMSFDAKGKIEVFVEH